MKYLKYGFSSLVLASSCLLFLTHISGCSGKVPTSRVSGKVTYNGKPVPGSIAFYGADDKGSSANLKADGSYVATDVPMGKVVVTVKSYTGSQMPGMPEVKNPGKTGIEEDNAEYVQIPSKYSDKVTSGLEYDISEEEKVLNIELK